MLLERIVSPGLAHYSYIVGDGIDAVVIDPRRDVDIYVDRVADEGMRLRAVLETHRHEDFVSGSTALYRRTGARVFHADSHLDYRYGEPVDDGRKWNVGGLTIEAMHSPGHTPGHMSYLLREQSGAPLVLFSGDALFAGGVGRVDFLGMGRAGEMAGQLYDTIFGRFLPLGDHLPVCPAHGAGSVCGSAIADRPLTTLGVERRLNPVLRSKDKREFVRAVAKELDRSPHFSRVERMNLEGSPDDGAAPVPSPLSVDEFADAAGECTVLDTRSELGFGASHIPGAISLWLQGVPAHAGWVLPQEGPICLVCEAGDSRDAAAYLFRLGFDDIRGYLSGGMLSWQVSGRRVESVGTVAVQDLCNMLDGGEEPWLLDVRKQEELTGFGSISGAHHIPLSQLNGRMREVPGDRPVHIFCGTGMRAMTSASLLQRAGWRNLNVVLGGLSGWTSAACPVEIVE